MSCQPNIGTYVLQKARAWKEPVSKLSVSPAMVVCEACWNRFVNRVRDQVEVLIVRAQLQS